MRCRRAKRHGHHTNNLVQQRCIPEGLKTAKRTRLCGDQLKRKRRGRAFPAAPRAGLQDLYHHAFGSMTKEDRGVISCSAKWSGKPHMFFSKGASSWDTRRQPDWDGSCGDQLKRMRCGHTFPALLHAGMQNLSCH